MPIDHERRFVFIHIPKTAGTSLLCSLFPVNVDKDEFIDSSRLTADYQARHLIGDNGFLRLHHYPLRRIVEKTALPLSEFFIFAFVRNPFDRLVSEYHFLRMHRSMPFRDFVLDLVHMAFALRKTEEWFSFHLLPQIEFISLQDGLRCDFLGRFETLDRDYRALCRRLNIESRPLPTHKKSQRRTYRDYYDRESRALVETLYRRDLEAFDYAF